MTSAYVGVLPHDVLDTLSLTLNDPFQARFLRLPHPRTGIPSLFLPYESDRANCGTRKSSILEVQAVAPPNARSWFIGEEVVADGKLLIMTPIDPALLLIPILQSTTLADGTSSTFRQLDDMMEIAASKLCDTQSPKDVSLVISKKDLLHLASISCIQSALGRVCDVKEISPEITVYRFSTMKLVEYLRVKVARLATPEVFEVSRTLIRGLAKDGLMEDGKEDLLPLGRIRAACDLVGQWVPADIKNLLLASYDFNQLNDYLKSALALANAESNKNTAEKTVDDQTTEVKKRKLQTKSSHGVEKLKKVNVNGMAKLSKFFKKA